MHKFKGFEIIKIILERKKHTKLMNSQCPISELNTELQYQECWINMVKYMISPEINLTFIFNKCAKTNKENIVFPANGAGTPEYSYAEKWRETCTLNHKKY